MTWRGRTSRNTWTDRIAGLSEARFPGISPSRRPGRSACRLPASYRHYSNTARWWWPERRARQTAPEFDLEGARPAPRAGS
jgi:hypothetical protein